MLRVVLRKTYGFHKKSDIIALSQFVKYTGLSKPHVIRARDILLEMNLIVTHKGNAFGLRYSFQKDYTKWKPLPKKGTLPKKGMRVAEKGNASLPKKVPTKDNSTKDTSSYEDSSNELKLNDPKIKKRKRQHKESYIDRARDRFCELWKADVENNQGDYPWEFGKDGKHCKYICDLYGEVGLMAVIERYFQLTDPYFDDNTRTMSNLRYKLATITAYLGLKKKGN